MSTNSSKEYQCIFITTWKQASTSHLSSRLTDNASGKHLIIFILYYLFVLPTSFLWIPKTHNRTSLHVWHANVLYFFSFCKPTLSGATREWDALQLVDVIQCSNQVNLNELSAIFSQLLAITGWTIRLGSFAPSTLFDFQSANEYNDNDNNVCGKCKCPSTKIWSLDLPAIPICEIKRLIFSNIP
jgi:hypothetical protein